MNEILLVLSICSVPFAQLIQTMSAKYELDWLSIAAQVKVESDFDPLAVSHAGAIGLMQIMLPTARWLLDIDTIDLFDPRLNVDLGCHYLRFLLNYWKKKSVTDYRFVLASYNCGQGKVLRVWRKYGKGSFESFYGALPRETRFYVWKIQSLIAKYREAINFKEGFDELAESDF